MMSQKSLKNNVNFNDFKRSLLNITPFALIAIFVLFVASTIPVIEYVNKPPYFEDIAKNGIQMFLAPASLFHSSVEFLFMGMVFCGVLMAYKSFYCLLSKKQTNVYLSVGITRNTLFANRTLSAVILLFLSTFIPIFITYLVNVSTFGNTKLLVSTFLYFFFGLFISGLVGFSIVAFAMTISGGLLDVILVVVSTSAIAPILYQLINTIEVYWLRGRPYSNSYEGFNLNALIPLTFVTKLFYDEDGSVRIHQLFDYISKEYYVDGKLPEKYMVDSNVIIPLIIWAVVSVIFVALAFVLINKRKAEHSNSFGHFPVARGVVSACIFTITATVVVNIITSYNLSSNPKIIISFTSMAIITIGITLVSFAIIQLIMARKIKPVVKAVPVWACFVAVFTAIMVFNGTEHFGTYNKLPAKEDIESVSIDYTISSLPYAHHIAYDGSASLKSKNPKDIEMICDLFEKCRDDKKGDFVTSISFLIKDKSGNEMIRNFQIHSPELENEYLETVANSAFFDAILEVNLLGFSKDFKSADGNYFYDGNKRGGMTGMANGFGDKDINFDYFHTQGVVYETEEVMSEDGEIVRSIKAEKGSELAIALYNDLSKMTYNDLMRKTEKPIGIFGVPLEVPQTTDNLIIPWSTQNDDIDVSEVKTNVRTVFSYINIYESMTETVKYLKDNNIEYKGVYDGKVKEILYTDSPLSVFNANQIYKAKHPAKFDIETIEIDIHPRSNMYLAPDTFTSNCFNGIKDNLDKEYKAYDLLKLVYTEAEHTLLTAPSEKHQDILAKALPSFLTKGDNGRFVYIIYEDGTMTCQYLPEASVGVLN